MSNNESQNQAPDSSQCDEDTIHQNQCPNSPKLNKISKIFNDGYQRITSSGSAAVQNRPCTALNCTALQQYCTALQFSSTSYLVKIQKHYP